MGMFDTIRYGNHEYQTKDTPEQGLEYYEIRGDELWFKKVEREWTEDDGSLFGGYLKEVSHEWLFCKDYDGAIRFYRDVERKEDGTYVWEEYKALFMDGRMLKCERIE